MVFALVGSGLFLIGVIYTYSITGHLLFPSCTRPSPRCGRRYVPVLHDGGHRPDDGGPCHQVRSVPVPLLDAGYLRTGHPASSGILSGVVSKAYILLLIKIVYRAVGIEVFSASGIQSVLLIFGIAGMIVGSVSAIRSKRLTTMVAYSSAAQIGYIYMGLGMGTQAALLAAFLHIFSHALTKPMLFLSASGLRDVSGGHNDFPVCRAQATAMWRRACCSRQALSAWWACRCSSGSSPSCNSHRRPLP